MNWEPSVPMNAESMPYCEWTTTCFPYSDQLLGQPFGKSGPHSLCGRSAFVCRKLAMNCCCSFATGACMESIARQRRWWESTTNTGRRWVDRFEMWIAFPALHMRLLVQFATGHVFSARFCQTVEAQASPDHIKCLGMFDLNLGSSHDMTWMFLIPKTGLAYHLVNIYPVILSFPMAYLLVATIKTFLFKENVLSIFTCCSKLNSKFTVLR